MNPWNIDSIKNEITKEKKEFKLLNEPVAMQLAFHFNNLVTYFHSSNELVRYGWDTKLEFSTEDILNSFDWVMANPQYIEDLFLEKYARAIFPLEFRVAQLINHYGAESIKNYIALVYGENRVG